MPSNTTIVIRWEHSLTWKANVYFSSIRNTLVYCVCVRYPGESQAPGLTSVLLPDWGHSLQAFHKSSSGVTLVWSSWVPRVTLDFNNPHYIVACSFKDVYCMNRDNYWLFGHPWYIHFWHTILQKHFSNKLKHETNIKHIPWLRWAGCRNIYVACPLPLVEPAELNPLRTQMANTLFREYFNINELFVNVKNMQQKSPYFS